MSIKDLDHALQLIAGRKDFVVKRDPHYIAVDYAVALPDTFDDPLRAELRGLKFYPDTGEIMARPLHKFFNLGERQDTQPHAISFDADHVITDKLDGSMIHPAILRDGTLRFMTRMGTSDVARKAERHLTDNLRSALRENLLGGVTPIFEFTAPDNRIVVHYPHSGLTLLAARYTKSGAYLSRADLETMSRELAVPLVKTWPRPRSADELISTVRTLSGAEGVVIAFASGLWLKIKSEEYVLMHKAKDSIAREKNVLAAILDGLADDLRPLLTPDDLAKFEAYEGHVTASLLDQADRVDAIVRAGAHLDQKAFAVTHLAGHPPWLRAVAFSVRAGTVSALQAVRQSLRKQCNTQTDVEAARDRIGAVWDAVGAGE